MDKERTRYFLLYKGENLIQTTDAMPSESDGHEIITITTTNLEPYYEATLTDVKTKTPNQILEDWKEREVKKQNMFKSMQAEADLKSEIIELIDDIKFAEEMGDPVDQMKEKLVILKTKYRNLQK